MGSDVGVVGGGITERADVGVDVIGGITGRTDAGVEDGVDVIGGITGRTDAGVEDGRGLGLGLGRWSYWGCLVRA